MKLRHKTPCDECPWRRVHPAGWLGGYKPEEFTQQMQFDGPPLPCHKTIAPGDTAPAQVSMCAGALIFMRNSCKSAQHPDYGDAREQVEPDPVNVFQWPHEFLAYHNDREGWLKRALEKVGGEEEGRCEYCNRLDSECGARPCANAIIDEEKDEV